MPRLSDFIEKNSILRDSEFSQPGHIHCEADRLLGYADTEPHLRALAKSKKVTCIITSQRLANLEPACQTIEGLAVCDNPRLQFYKIHELFIQNNLYPKPTTGSRGKNLTIHPTAFVHPDADLDQGTQVGAFASIAACCKIGQNVRIEPGVRIGVEGILYSKNPDHIRHIPHAGIVVIADHATLLTGCTIVRSVHPAYPTRIGARAIIGINSTVGHEAQIGADTIISGQTVIARNTRIADGSFVGPGCILVENLSVGPRARILAGSVVIRNVPESAVVSGNFARDHIAHLRELATSL